jgi:hypothetical protein
MTDAELMDLLKVPDQERPELLHELHAWSRSVLPGPNAYAIQAAVMWQMRKHAPYQTVLGITSSEYRQAMVDNDAMGFDPTGLPST